MVDRDGANGAPESGAVVNWRAILCAFVGHEDRYREDGLGAAWYQCGNCGKVTNWVTMHGGQPWRRQQQILEVGPDGWVCAACSDYRPQNRISFLTRRRIVGELEEFGTVRYCNDRPLCKERAYTLARKQGAA